jgi:hypothetical protein
MLRIRKVGVFVRFSFSASMIKNLFLAFIFVSSPYSQEAKIQPWVQYTHSVNFTYS